MNLSFVAALAFFFSLAAASLALRIATADTTSVDDGESSSAKRPRAKAL